jgi:hypothetical protein
MLFAHSLTMVELCVYIQQYTLTDLPWALILILKKKECGREAEKKELKFFLTFDSFTNGFILLFYFFFKETKKCIAINLLCLVEEGKETTLRIGRLDDCEEDRL